MLEPTKAKHHKGLDSIAYDWFVCMHLGQLAMRQPTHQFRRVLCSDNPTQRWPN